MAVKMFVASHKRKQSIIVKPRKRGKQHQGLVLKRRGSSMLGVDGNLFSECCLHLPLCQRRWGSKRREYLLFIGGLFISLRLIVWFIDSGLHTVIGCAVQQSSVSVMCSHLTCLQYFWFTPSRCSFGNHHRFFSLHIFTIYLWTPSHFPIHFSWHSKACWPNGGEMRGGWCSWLLKGTLIDWLY